MTRDMTRVTRGLAWQGLRGCGRVEERAHVVPGLRVARVRVSTVRPAARLDVWTRGGAGGGAQVATRDYTWSFIFMPVFVGISRSRVRLASTPSLSTGSLMRAWPPASPWPRGWRTRGNIEWWWTVLVWHWDMWWCYNGGCDCIE